MAYDHRNLCETVQATHEGAYRARCTVPRLKITPLYARIAREDNDPDYAWEDCHSWDKATGRCTRCKLTVKEIMVYPKKKAPSKSAREIAIPRDVPPIHFVGTMP